MPSGTSKLRSYVIECICLVLLPFYSSTLIDYILAYCDFLNNGCFFNELNHTPILIDLELSILWNTALRFPLNGH